MIYVGSAKSEEYDQELDSCMGECEVIHCLPPRPAPLDRPPGVAATVPTRIRCGTGTWADTNLSFFSWWRLLSSLSCTVRIGRFSGLHTIHLPSLHPSITMISTHSALRHRLRSTPLPSSRTNPSRDQRLRLPGPRASPPPPPLHRARRDPRRDCHHHHRFVP